MMGLWLFSLPGLMLPLPSLEGPVQRYRLPSPTVEFGGIRLNSICASPNAETRRWEFIFAVNPKKTTFFFFKNGDETRYGNINATHLFRFMTAADGNLASLAVSPLEATFLSTFLRFSGAPQTASTDSSEERRQFARHTETIAPRRRFDSPA